MRLRGIWYFHVVPPRPLSIHKTFSSSQMETVHPLNNSQPSPSHHSTFCPYEWTIPHLSEIIQHLSLCGWPISPFCHAPLGCMVFWPLCSVAVDEVNVLLFNSEGLLFRFQKHTLISGSPIAKHLPWHNTCCSLTLQTLEERAQAVVALSKLLISASISPTPLPNRKVTLSYQNVNINLWLCAPSPSESG